MVEQNPRVLRKCAVMLAVALAVRLLAVAFLYRDALNPSQDYWRFGGEVGRIARSIVQGHGFSNPYFADTGPTALEPPLYIYLLAGIFKIFGVYTKSAALAILFLNCMVSALTCIPVFLIGRKSFGEVAGSRAAWAWALFPFSIYFAAGFIWPTVFTTFLLTLLSWIALNLENSSSLVSWGGFGLLYGISALTDPIVMSVFPFLLAWAAFSSYKKGRQWLPPMAAAGLAFLAVLSPWLGRNYLVFHKPIPVRDNFPMELFIGNSGVTWHWAAPRVHPSAGGEEWKQYTQLGETAYLARKQVQAMDFIRDHKKGFALLSLRRALYFWTNFWSFGRRYLAEEPFDPLNIVFSTALSVLALIGLRKAFQQKIFAAVPFAIIFVFFPLVYYITHPEDYYRRPIDPFFVLLGAYALTRARRYLAGEGLKTNDQSIRI